MERSTIITIGVIGLIILSIGLYTWFSVHKSASEAITNSAAGMALNGGDSVYTDLAGNPVDLQDYLGAPLVVNSWASWCPFCIKELPDFDVLAAEYQAEGVVVLAINRHEATDQVDRFINHLPVLQHVTMILDTNDAFYKSIGGFAMPETVFYDAGGNVVVHKRGVMDLEEMRRHVDATLTASKAAD